MRIVHWESSAPSGKLVVFFSIRRNRRQKLAHVLVLWIVLLTTLFGAILFNATAAARQQLVLGEGNKTYVAKLMSVGSLSM